MDLTRLEVVELILFIHLSVFKIARSTLVRVVFKKILLPISHLHMHLSFHMYQGN